MRHRRGFTLVETIFSTLFIGLTVLAIMNLFPGAYLSVKTSESNLQADFIAKSVVDEIRSNLNFQELAASSKLSSAEGWENPDILPLDRAPFFPVTLEQVRYEPKVSLHEVPGMDPQSIVAVRVKVKYRTGLLSEPKEMVHETYLHTMGVRQGGFYTMSEGTSP